MAGSMQHRDQWIEATNDGCTVYSKRIWPFKPRECSIAWSEVKEIHAAIWDCVACHLMFLYFVREGKKDFVVDETMGNYDECLDIVQKVFPGYDKDQNDEVERCFPGEASRSVWKHK